MNGQLFRNNTVYVFSRDYLHYDLDISDTVPLLYRLTEKDTIINDTLGTIKYLINENQRLYDLIYEQNKRLTDLSITIGSLILYKTKHNDFFEL